MKTVLVFVLIPLLGISVYYGYIEYNTHSVSYLNDNATQYDNKTVRVRGTVGKSIGILGVGGYLLVDKDSSIAVASNHGIPSSGKEVTITGTFQKAVSINTFQYNILTQSDIEN